MNNLTGTQTEQNLRFAFSGESEARNKYTFFAKVAKQEGFPDIAAAFEKVGEIERSHEDRYNQLIDNMSGNKVFAKDSDVRWICRNCGHIAVGAEAPLNCPVCSHPQSYFELVSENY